MLRLNSNPDLKLGDVTTVNWTITEVSVLDLLIFFFFFNFGRELRSNIVVSSFSRRGEGVRNSKFELKVYQGGEAPEWQE